MLSAIFTLATNTTSSNNKEDTEAITSEEEEQSIYYEQCSESRVIEHQDCEPILAMLEDKNKTIESLQKRIENQKMQLSYYLKKKLNASNLEKWSASCSLQASDESIPLNLAINKFYRQTGTKTKLSHLHERMTQLDSQISNSLKDQEFVLRKVVNRLCEFVRKQAVSGQSQARAVAFGDFVTDPLNINLFDKLLSATVTLRRKLDSLKIFCDRVLIIEEERNEIVDQVYSMPTEKRLNYNYLLGIQMEKAELETQIKRLTEHQKPRKINAVEERCSNLSWGLSEKSLVKREEGCISKVLHAINLEAQSLLRLTQEQKLKMEKNIGNSTLPNINQIIFYIKMVLSCDNLRPQILEIKGVKNEEEIRLCQEIKCEINKIEDTIYQKFQEQFEYQNQICETLKTKLHEVCTENEKLKETNQNLKRNFYEVKLNQQNNVQVLKAERDSYKAQVEDLQAIREAYAQLVEKQPVTTKKEREYLKEIDIRDKRIFDLENEFERAIITVHNLERMVEDLKTQIAVLNRIIVNISQNANNNTDKSVDTTSSREDFSSCPSSRSKLKIEDSAREITTVSEKKIVIEKRTFPSKKITRKLPPVSARNLYLNKNLKTFAKPTNVMFENSRCRRRRQISPNRDDSNCFRAQSYKTLEGGSFTCFKVYSQKNGKTSDIVKAVVSTSGDVKGNLKIDNASTFSVEFKCKNRENIHFERGDSDVDEYELFRDCSKETLSNIYQATAKFKKSVEFKKFGFVDYRQ